MKTAAVVPRLKEAMARATVCKVRLLEVMRRPNGRVGIDGAGGQILQGCQIQGGRNRSDNLIWKRKREEGDGGTSGWSVWEANGAEGRGMGDQDSVGDSIGGAGAGAYAWRS